MFTGQRVQVCWTIPNLLLSDIWHPRLRSTLFLTQYNWMHAKNAKLQEYQGRKEKKKKIRCWLRSPCVSWNYCTMFKFPDVWQIQVDTKKTGTFAIPNKNWRNPRKKNIDRKWTITTCLLRDSNPIYQCLKITSCRWRPPPRTHAFTGTTHFKSSRSFVSLCVRCILCRMRLCRNLQSMQHTQGDTNERELLKCVVAVKACVRGGGRHLQEVVFKHW